MLREFRDKGPLLEIRTGLTGSGHGLEQRAEIPPALGMSSWYLPNQCQLALEPI